MAPPTTAAEFLDLVRGSEALDEGVLAAALVRAQLAGMLPTDPAGLAAQFVRDGVLTEFQAEQLLQGHWRRFMLGPYRVLERLSARLTGAMYLCEHLVLNRRRVAVKVLPTSMASDLAARQRFLREAQITASLHHSNVIRAFEVCQVDGMPLLVTEHVDGSGLKEIVKRTGPMNALRAAHYVRQAALGLQHVHERGFIHRHVKPSNVLVSRDGVVKLIDLSLARPVDDALIPQPQATAPSLLCTPDYVAPELTRPGQPTDCRADVYSLGCTFYFCLAGRPPFAGGTVDEKLRNHRTRLPTPIRERRPDVPEEIAAVVARMMEKEVDARFQTAQEVADALAPHTRTPIPPPSVDEMPRLCPALSAPLETRAVGC